MPSFNARTEENDLTIDYYASFIKKQDISVDKLKFKGLCESGCRNYNQKYSCPPFSPSFESLASNHEGLFVLMFRCRLDQISSAGYNKVRIANAVMKSRIDRLMRELESKFKTTFLSTGSCRLCRPCKCKSNQPCRHPDKRRYSLEAVGIDCNHLSESLFNIPLQWFRDKRAPEYTCVLCGLFSDKEDAREIEKEIKRMLSG